MSKKLNKEVASFIFKMGYEGPLYAMENFSNELEKADPALDELVKEVCQATRRVYDYIEEEYGVEYGEYEEVCVE